MLATTQPVTQVQIYYSRDTRVYSNKAVHERGYGNYIAGMTTKSEEEYTGAMSDYQSNG